MARSVYAYIPAGRNYGTVGHSPVEKSLETISWLRGHQTNRLNIISTSVYRSNAFYRIIDVCSFTLIILYDNFYRNKI